jgi:hypothetical protein
MGRAKGLWLGWAFVCDSPRVPFQAFLAFGTAHPVSLRLVLNGAATCSETFAPSRLAGLNFWTELWVGLAERSFLPPRPLLQ